MTRKSITSSQRVRIFDAVGGVCHLCSLKIDGTKEPWDVEHVKPLHMGGADEPSNMRPAHVHCHRVKTSGEATIRAKTDRVRAKHIGAKRQATRPMPCSRTTNFKRRFDGSVVRRDAQ